jgi:hypothetical protein
MDNGKVLIFNKPYTEVLKSLGPVRKAVSSKDLKLMRAGNDQVGLSVIPPMNANIMLSPFLPKYTKPKTFRSIPLPKSWDWTKISDNDTAVNKAKKKLITTPPNQGLCGSCWAMAMAGCMSDVFVCSGKVDKNPGISPTFMLSCYQDRSACNGGNPAELASEIQSQGCTNDNCIDYEIFCNPDTGCRAGPASKHFEGEGDLNSFVPKCGCVNPNIKHKKFFINSPAVHDDADFNTVKQHIFEHGSVIGCYHVFRNFIGGNFSGTAGVYLENYRYDTDGNATFDTTQNDGDKWIGGHAVAIVGWGETTFKNKPLPYWIVRNSWGENWGDGGYFKMGFFGKDPEVSNQSSQFDRSVVIQINFGTEDQPDFQNARIGGIVSFKAGDIKDDMFLAAGVDSKDPKFSTPFVVKPLVVSNDDKKDEKDKNGDVVSTPFYKQPWFIILVAVILIYWYTNRNKSSIKSGISSKKFGFKRRSILDSLEY